MSEEASSQVVTLFAMWIEERIGLHYAAPDRTIFATKLQVKAEEEGFESLLDYYYALRYDDPRSHRLQALVDALIVGETYFFREQPALDRIVEQVAERASGGRRTRIWSAACATGEEPLSVVVLLARASLLDHVDIVASDVSERQLARARRGEHTRRALRACPDGMPPWLQACAGRAVVEAGLRARVRWLRVNLIEAEAVAALGRFDIILCRNVLIYFEEATVRRVVANLSAALAPDGILLIGASESLLRLGTLLTCTERGGAFLYHREKP
jgi:chemotaxis protein methyltransferase CheR